MKNVRTLGACLLALMGAHFTVSANAETLNVNQMTFKNNGAYSGTPYIIYKIGENKKCVVFEDGKTTLNSGKSFTFQLGNNDKFETELDSHKECEDGEIPDGVEVWGALAIHAGERSSCRKSKTLKLRNFGGTVVYSFGGTTQNNNRCKVRKWPG